MSEFVLLWQQWQKLTHSRPLDTHRVDRDLYIHPIFEIPEGNLDGHGPIVKLDYRSIGMFEWHRTHYLSLNSHVCVLSLR